MWHTMLMVAALFTLPGCINMTTNLQPIDQTVRAVVQGHDCIPIIFGIGIGANTVEQAKIADLHRATESRLDERVPVTTPITRVRSVALTDMQFLMFGERCLDVEGEP